CTTRRWRRPGRASDRPSGSARAECIAMISAATLQSRDAVSLLASLGYDPMPIAIAPGEWRRAGIDVAWNDDVRVSLAVHLPRLDVYLVDALLDDEAAARFLRSLAAYNVVTKPVLLAQDGRMLAIYDLSSHRELRRLDVDCERPSAHALDRLN